jgi:DNA mismatch endonuclease (patch repair protein)
MGYRYRLHKKDLPGTPDLVFASRKKVIFVHGCFWHRHDEPECRLARLPKSRLDFWLPKLTRNTVRDRQVQARLADEGWTSMVIWECQVRDADPLKRRISEFLDS